MTNLFIILQTAQSPNPRSQWSFWILIAIIVLAVLLIKKIFKGHIDNKEGHNSDVINKVEKQSNNETRKTDFDRIKNLKEIKKLYDEGVLTEEEFNSEKKKILNT